MSFSTDFRDDATKAFHAKMDALEKPILAALAANLQLTHQQDLSRTNRDCPTETQPTMHPDTIPTLRAFHSLRGKSLPELAAQTLFTPDQLHAALADAIVILTCLKTGAECQFVHRSEVTQMAVDLANLRRWKAERLAVDAQWDPQEVGRILEIPLGWSVRENITECIRQMKAELDDWKSGKRQLPPAASPIGPTEYQPEVWAVKKDAIYAAKSALAEGAAYTQELLANHDRDLGRTTRSNELTAGHMEQAIADMLRAMTGLRKEAKP